MYHLHVFVYVARVAHTSKAPRSPPWFRSLVIQCVCDMALDRVHLVGLDAHDKYTQIVVIAQLWLWCAEVQAEIVSD